jgi:SAM-dependent methyltransferase
MGDAQAGIASAYDAIAKLYDPWSRSVVEDVAFYVDEASRAAPGPIVELGVGTGRIAVPVAAAGVDIIGVDSSPGMLEICREQAELAGVSERLDLRLGDYRTPPVTDPVDLVLCPFRAYLHLHSDEERLDALRAAHDLLNQAVASSSTCSRRVQRTSRRRTAGGWSASPGSTNAPTGTRCAAC